MNKRSSLYNIWWNMRDRCMNPKNSRYSSYGGRGIKICERWLIFENFSTDMNTRPSLQYSLNRINNDGNYEPSNCNWATRHEQQNNKRCNRQLTYRDVTKTLTQWAAIIEMDYCVLEARIRRKWKVERAFDEPIEDKKETFRKVNALIEKGYNIKQVATELGLTNQCKTYWARKYGFTQKRLTQAERQQIAELYKKGYSAHKVSEMLSIPYNSVAFQVKRMKIGRTKSEASRLRWGIL